MFVFIAVTSKGIGGSPPPSPVIAWTEPPIPRYNDIAATPSADFTATAPHLLQDQKKYRDQ